MPTDPLHLFHRPVRAWFDAVFPAPTRPQQLGWPPIARGESTLILAPTGTGTPYASSKRKVSSHPKSLGMPVNEPSCNANIDRKSVV